MKNQILFFIFCLPRSGSTLFSYILDSHPEIEVLHEDSARPFTDRKDRNLYNLKYKINHDYEKYLYDNRSTGKKILITSRYFTLKQATILNEKIDRNRIKILILSRKNMWRVFRKDSGDFVIVPIKHIINFELCKLYLKYKFRKNAHFVQFNSLVSQPSKTFTDICSFLNVKFEPTMLNYWEYEHNNRGNVKTKKLKKIIDKSSSESISFLMIVEAFRYRVNALFSVIKRKM